MINFNFFYYNKLYSYNFTKQWIWVHNMQFYLLLNRYSIYENYIYIYMYLMMPFFNRTGLQRVDIYIYVFDDAFFQPDWATACWGRWAGPGLLLGWSTSSGYGSSLQKEQE